MKDTSSDWRLIRIRAAHLYQVAHAGNMTVQSFDAIVGRFKGLQTLAVEGLSKRPGRETS